MRRLSLWPAQVHADIKPANVLVTKTPHMVKMDLAARAVAAAAAVDAVRKTHDARDRAAALAGSEAAVPFVFQVAGREAVSAAMEPVHAGRGTNQPQVFHTSTGKCTDITCLMPGADQASPPAAPPPAKRAKTANTASRA